MLPRPIGTPDTTVVVTYDCRGKRVTKQFTNPYQARRFYADKDKAGKNPTLTKGTP